MGVGIDCASASDLGSAAFAAEPASVLDRRHVVYMDDISRMPALVTRLFALPKLCELPFAIGLMRDADQAAQAPSLPRRPGGTTLLRLKYGREVEVLAVTNGDELRTALGLARQSGSRSTP